MSAATKAVAYCANAAAGRRGSRGPSTGTVERRAGDRVGRFGLSSVGVDVDGDYSMLLASGSNEIERVR